MKNIDYITKTLRRPFAGAALCALALAGALSVTGCRKQGIPASKGDNVLFSAGIGGSESGTKTSYTDSNASDRRQPENINWLSGDLIRIWSAECSEPTDHYADYAITPNTESGSPSGTIAVRSGTVGLRWGEAGTDHHFYAVYPSPLTTDKESDAGTLSASDPKFSFMGHIPATQNISGLTTGQTTESDKTITTTVASPDMANLYMVSKAQATPESDGTGVFLRFTPLSTAIQFTISKDSENEDKVLYVALESANHELNGAFSANISEWTPAESGSYVYPACTSMNSGNNRVEINMGGQGGQEIKVSNSKYLTFTFFLLPVSGTQNVVDDLSFIISKEDSDGAVATLKTKLSMADGSKITFPTHKKTYVKGILVPDGLVTLSVTTTDYGLEPPTDPTTVGETVNYNEQGSTNPTTGGSTGDYGSEGSTDPTTGGSTGNYNEQGSTNPTTGGSTGDYGSEAPTDPTTGGSTGDYKNNYNNIFPKQLPLPGVFTVGVGKTVKFSSGNLWADSSNALHFETEQWKSTPESNGSKASSHISHFTWSSTVADAVSDTNSGGNLFCDETHKVSVNGSEAIFYALSNDEWTYLFNTRTVNGGTGEGKSYQRATINSDITSGVYGVILYPDNYTAQTSAASYTSAEWAAMESAGCVFLPAAGYRSGSDVSNVGLSGYYWSSSTDGDSADSACFTSDEVYFDGSCDRINGCSVRLVTDSK